MKMSHIKVAGRRFNACPHVPKNIFEPSNRYTNIYIDTFDAFIYLFFFLNSGKVQGRRNHYYRKL